MFTDTHCHFDNQYYSFDEFINNALNSNVNRLILSGFSISENEKVIDISQKYSNVYVSIGYHPDQADVITDRDISLLESQLNNNKVVAIGEIGLDYHYEGYDKEKQINLFKKQLDLAVKYNLPVVIHTRDAVLDTINILKDYKVTGVIHSFSGSYETAITYLKMGFKLGINGVVTFKNCNLKSTLIKLPIDSIVLETDSPYLTPHPYRGLVNESKNILIISEYLCNLYNIDLEELSKITNENVNRIFDI